MSQLTRRNLITLAGATGIITLTGLTADADEKDGNEKHSFNDEILEQVHKELDSLRLENTDGSRPAKRF